jgi:hypothetical protein
VNEKLPWHRQPHIPPPDVSVVPVISASLAEQVAAVPPANHPSLAYKPCAVTLHDSTVRDYVYVQEVNAYLATWGILPADNSGAPEVALADVASITSSPSRLPPEIAEAIYREGESGMGYYKFELVFSDGETAPCVTGDAVDFVRLPDGRAPSDVVAVNRLERSDDRWSAAEARLVDYAWCLYREPPDDPPA